MSNEKGWGMRAFDWFEERLPIVSFIDHSVGSKYPAPKNLNYFWNFGSLAGFMLVVMILTGIFLAMAYTPHVDHAFQSVERIMRDVNSGWNCEARNQGWPGISTISPSDPSGETPLSVMPAFSICSR